jgi:hypothetical protein
VEEVDVEAEEIIDTIQYFESGSGVAAVVHYQSPYN